MTVLMVYFKPYIFIIIDRNQPDQSRYGGGLLLYVNEEIPYKILNQQTASSSSEPPKQDNSEFLKAMNILSDNYTETYENIIILGHFNMTVENPQLNGFVKLLMSHLINEPTCFESHDPTCIDNILANQKTTFKTSKTFESALSDHHKLVPNIMKSGSFRGPPRKKINRS